MLFYRGSKVLLEGSDKKSIPRSSYQFFFGVHLTLTRGGRTGGAIFVITNILDLALLSPFVCKLSLKIFVRVSFD